MGYLVIPNKSASCPYALITDGHRFHRMGSILTFQTTGAWGNYFDGFYDADQDTMLMDGTGIISDFLTPNKYGHTWVWGNGKTLLLVRNGFWLVLAWRFRTYGNIDYVREVVRWG